MTVSIPSWLTVIRSVPSGPGAIAVLAGATAALLAVGLAPWGRAYARNVAGFLALGIGCQAAMVAAVFALTLRGALLAPAIGRMVRRIRTIDRPILVWAVLAWELHVGVSALASIGLMRSYGDLLTPELQRYLADTRPYVVPWSLAVAALGLVGGALLVRLRRAALWPFVAQVALRVGYVLSFGGFVTPPGVPGFLWIVAVAHAIVIDVAILGYVVWLRRRDHLG